MSTMIMALCWPLQMPPTQKSVLVSLADNANDHGECWPSISTICERTCFGKSAVIDAIKWLEETHALRADRSNGRHTSYAVTPNDFDPSGKQTGPANKPVCLPDTTGPAAAPDLSTSRTGPVRQPDTNRKEPSRTVSSNRHTRAKDELPSWLPADAWKDWCDYRRSRKGAWTPKAQELSMRKLDELRAQGHDPKSVIELAIERGWQGLFAPRDGPAKKHAANERITGKIYTGTPDHELPDFLRGN